MLIIVESCVFSLFCDMRCRADLLGPPISGTFTCIASNAVLTLL